MNWINVDGVKRTEAEQLRMNYGVGLIAASRIGRRFATALSEYNIEGVRNCIRDAYVMFGNALSKAGYGAKNFREGFLELAEPITMHVEDSAAKNFRKAVTATAFVTSLIW